MIDRPDYLRGSSARCEEAIRRAVDEVLTEEGYRKNAERLRDEYASYRPFDNIARIIEEFVRTA